MQDYKERHQPTQAEEEPGYKGVEGENGEKVCIDKDGATIKIGEEIEFTYLDGTTERARLVEFEEEGEAMFQFENDEPGELYSVYVEDWGSRVKKAGKAQDTTEKRAEQQPQVENTEHSTDISAVNFEQEGEIRYIDENGNEVQGYLTGYRDPETGKLEYYKAGERKMRYATDEELRGMVKEFKPTVSKAPAERVEAGAAEAPVTESYIQPVSAAPSEPVDAEQPVEQPVGIAEEAAEETAEEPMPVDKDGEPRFMDVTPERGHAYIFGESGLDRARGRQFVKNNVEAAQQALEKLKKKEPEIGTSIARYNKQKAEWQQKVDDAQRALDYWKAVGEVQRGVEAAEAAERERVQAEQTEAAKAKYEAEKASAEQAEAERQAVGYGNAMPVIAERYNSRHKIYGKEKEIILPNGERVKGRYVLTRHDAPTPSHDPFNGYAKSEGFPMNENGTTINDRDYERDLAAQQANRDRADNFDGRAVQNPPIWSSEGVIMSGNDRDMARQLAHANGTDGRYMEDLRNSADQFGFTAEQVDDEHDFLGFELSEPMEYTTENFAKFNAQEMKSQSNTETAVKMGKVVNDGTFKGIVRRIGGFDTLGDFYNDPKAGHAAVGALLEAGVVGREKLPELLEGPKGHEKLTEQGKKLLEAVLVGKFFEKDPEAVRILSEHPTMRQRVVFALSELADNFALGKDYSLEEEMTSAVRLCGEALSDGAQELKQGDKVSFYARQGVLFEEYDMTEQYRQCTVMMLADLLNHKNVSELKKVVTLYDGEARVAAAGQGSLDFGGGGSEVRTRESILKDVLNKLRYGSREQIEESRRAAVGRRKSSIQEDGSVEPGDAAGAEGAGGRGNVRPGDEREGDLHSASPAEVGYELSDEVDENGRQFVLNSEGNIEFGRIDASTGLTGAPILLSEGIITNPKTKEGYGLIHIEARHGAEIRSKGYGSVIEFIETVAKNWTIIREGKDRSGNQTYRLIAVDGHNNTLMVELSGEGTYWNINTAGIFKSSYGKNNREIYNRHTTVNQSTETDEASQGTEQSGTTGPSRMNAPISDVSERKDNESLSKEQIPGEKSSSQPVDGESEQAIVQKAKPSKGDFFVSKRTGEVVYVGQITESGKYRLFGEDTASVKTLSELHEIFRPATEDDIASSDWAAKTWKSMRETPSDWGLEGEGNSVQSAVEAASAEVDTNPTEAQSDGREPKAPLEDEDYVSMAERVSADAEQDAAEQKFVQTLQDRLGKEKMDITTLRKLAQEHGLSGRIDTDLQELTELAIVNKAREIARTAPTLAEGYRQIVELYQSQPTISRRSSERVAKQQYSTPIPLGYLADAFVNAIQPKSALEPSGGNGMMIHALDPGIVHANDIDKMRLRNLGRQGFARVTAQDGREPFGERQYDVVVTNPPFGIAAAKDYDGFPISGLEKQMAINALESMKDRGRAAIIIGGNTEYDEKGRIKGGDRIFFNYLYSRYNVVDVINVSGSLYGKQGTTYPVRMILIDGRRPMPAQEYAPRRDAARAEQVKTFDELFKRINDEILRSEELSKTHGDTAAGGERGGMGSLFDWNDGSGDAAPDSATGVPADTGVRREPGVAAAGHSAGHGDAAGHTAGRTGGAGGRRAGRGGGSAGDVAAGGAANAGGAGAGADRGGGRRNAGADRGRGADTADVVVGSGVGAGRTVKRGGGAIGHDGNAISGSHSTGEGHPAAQPPGTVTVGGALDADASSTVAQDMISNSARFGGSAIIIYGSDPSVKEGYVLRGIKDRLQRADIRLNDGIYIRGRAEGHGDAGYRYDSAADSGQMEPEGKYEDMRGPEFGPGKVYTEEEVSHRFDEQIDRHASEGFHEGDVYQLGKPSEKLVAAGFPADQPIEMSAAHLDAKSRQRNHPFDIMSLKGLVSALRNPLAVFPHGDPKKSLNAIVELRHGADNFIIGVHFNREKGGKTIASIRGIFPKYNTEWLKWIENGKAIGIDKTRLMPIVVEMRDILSDKEKTEKYLSPRFTGGDLTDINLDLVAKIVNDFGKNKGEIVFDDIKNSGISFRVSGESAQGAEGKAASAEAKRGTVKRMSEALHTPITIVEDAKDTTLWKEADAATRAEIERSKGWYDHRTGEVVVVMGRNHNVEDVEQSMLHEVVAHRGIDEMLGGAAEADAFYDEVYEHLKSKERARVNEKMGANGWDAAKATKEYMGELAEKGFEDFDEAERGIWKKFKAKVLEWLDRMLAAAGVKLPRWVKLGDNELRYMLWRSRERLNGKNGKNGGDYVAMAADAAKRAELRVGSKISYRDPGETEDIWEDRSVGMQERITNAAVRLSANNAADQTMKNEALRAVCDNLQDLVHEMRNRSGRTTKFKVADGKVGSGVRTAAAAQRLYDRTTVKRVSDLARILMQNGYLREMTSGEMQRIVSALKNATGAEDIGSSVEKIMDIMIDNQVRSGREALGELMGIRGSKVDARGVEVQGDSMLPSITSGALILAKEIPEKNWHYAEGVVVMVFSEFVVVKRIERNDLLNNNLIVLSSDNELYGKLTVPLSDIRAIYKAKRILSSDII